MHVLMGQVPETGTLPRSELSGDSEALATARRTSSARGPEPTLQGSASDIPRRVANGWTLAALALVLTASAAGLLGNGIYGADAASTTATLGAYDLVTAVVIVPLLALSLRFARRGSAHARLLCVSLLAYLLYTYAYYVFGTALGGLLVMHTAIIATVLIAFCGQLAGLDVAAFEHRLQHRARNRGAAAVLGLLAAALGGMWIYTWLDAAASGTVPIGSLLVETDVIIQLATVLDLGLLVPLYTAAAVLLVRRSTWGYVLGVIALVAGVLHQVSYVVAMPAPVAAGIPGAVAYDPTEPIIASIYLLGAFLLLRRNRRPGPDGSDRAEVQEPSSGEDAEHAPRHQGSEREDHARRPER